MTLASQPDVPDVCVNNALREEGSLGALRDWWKGTSDVSLWWTLARKDILDRYRRSLLGPLWLTISMGVALIGMGPLYATLFRVPINKFFPHLALGVILWAFISGIINDSCMTFVSAATYLKFRPYPLCIFIWRTVARNTIQLFHQLPVFLPLAYFTGVKFSWATLLAVPGLILLIVNLHAISFIAAIVCTRFRDVPQVIASSLQLVVFLTPVLWLPESLPSRARMLVHYNPFAQMLDAVRLPLLGQCPTPKTWIVLVIWTTACWVVAAVLFRACRRRIVYWL